MMPFDFVLPDLGEGMTEGEVRKWLVREGDSIDEHQTVLEIETDKAVVEVPSPRKGRVLQIKKGEGEVVRVGETLMTILEAGEEAEETKKERVSVSVVGVLPEEEEVLATPAVRALAKERGVSLEGIKGSGPGGSITREDVMSGPEKTKPSVKPLEDRYGQVERRPIRGVRRSIVKNLLTTLRTYASVTGMDEADVTELWDLREREKDAVKKKGVRLTFVPFFIKAVQHALALHPLMNASVDDEREEIVLKKYFNIGIATDTPDGLMVPVIKDADKKTILELATELQELTLRARDRKIRLEDLKGGTFTITNFGSLGGAFATPIINFPESAILGTGRISERPWVKDGQIAIRKVLPLSLTFDHRVTDGADASVFLTRVKRYLEDPASIFIESS
jgi:pyruvate dehydrogenase E2 component (dihydrolipoamide acetyltransferase)